MLGIPVEHCWALSLRNWASIEMLQWPEEYFFIILNTSMLVWQLLNHLIQISCDQIYEFQWHLLIQFYETEYSWSQIWSWYLFFWFKHMSIQNTSPASSQIQIDFLIFCREIIEIILTVLMMYWILTYFQLRASPISISQRGLIADHIPITVIWKLNYFIDTLGVEQQISRDKIIFYFHENLFCLRDSCKAHRELCTKRFSFNTFMELTLFDIY